MGNRGGSSGGAGPAGRKQDGSLGTAADAKKTSKRNEGIKIVRDIAKASPVGNILKAVDTQVKKSKAKKEANVEVGLGSESMSDFSTPERDGEDNRKSQEQPKVKSQMDNTEIKSQNINADQTAPTTTEMPDEADTVELTEDEKLLRRKRGRKTKTVLTSVTGDNTKATLGRKTLLGY